MIPTYKEVYTCEGPGPLPQVSWDQLVKVSLLGHGAFGCTYQGLLTLQDGHRVDVAIKALHYEDAGAVLVYKEARILQKVAGAGGAPRLYGVTTEVPRAIVMELCSGEVLGNFPVNCPTDMTCVEAYLAAFKALKELHETGYVHHDIHEGNIMIITDEVDSSHRTTARLIDFGGAVYMGDIEDSDATVDAADLYRLALEVESCMGDIQDDDAGTCREFRATLRRIELVLNRNE